MNKKFAVSLLLVTAALALQLALGPKPWNSETLARVLTAVATPFDVRFYLRDWLATFGWLAALANFVVLCALILSHRWWIGPATVPAIELRTPETPPVPRHGISRRKRLLTGAMIAGAVLLSAWMAYPRLSQSFWGDEDYTMRWHLHGQFRRNPDLKIAEDEMSPYFRKLPWADALWGYNTTNNHFLFTVLGKLSLASWQRFTGAEMWEFKENVLRLLPYVCGLGGVAAWMLLFRGAGFPALAALSGLPLALHPWFIRYISEARGYGFVFLLLPLNLLVVRRCLEQGRWRWWLLHSLTQFLLLYSWPGMAFHALGMNVIFAGAVLWTRGFNGGGYTQQLKRWAVANLFAVMALAHLVAPCIPQVIPYLTKEHLPLDVSLRWHLDILSLLLLGTHWQPFDPHGDNPLYISIQGLSEHTPFLLPAFLCLMVLLGLIGTAAGIRRPGWMRTLTLMLIAPALLFYLYGLAGGKYLFHWYFVYLVPAAMFFVLLGLRTSADFVSRRLRTDETTATALTITHRAVFAVFLLAFAAATHPKRHVLRRHSVDPLRESVLLTRPSLDPYDESNLGVITGHVHFAALTYDPYGFLVHEAKDGESRSETRRNVRPELPRMMRWADAYGVPLYINVGFPDDALIYQPRTMKLLDNAEWFEKLPTVWALEPQFDRVIYRYKGGFWLFQPANDPRTNESSFPGKALQKVYFALSVPARVA